MSKQAFFVPSLSHSAITCNKDSIGAVAGHPTGRKIAKEWYQSVNFAFFSIASNVLVKKPN